MTSISGVVAGTAPAAITTSTSLASIAAPKAVAQVAVKIGPAATLDLSQAALAKIKGDKDWRPGMSLDSI
jgi:hypothetical protein